MRKGWEKNGPATDLGRRNFFVQFFGVVSALLPLPLLAKVMKHPKESTRNVADADLAFASIAQLSLLFQKNRISASGLVELFLKRIKEIDAGKNLHAFVYVNSEAARTLASSLDQRKGKRGRLHGIPIALKDDLEVKDLPLSLGSALTSGWKAPSDAFVVRRLKSEGAIILGKTNLDEFTLGVSGRNIRFGQTLNPFDVRKAPGGSSAGSAAATAAGLCVAAIGSDASGSVRLPASACGIVGYKPSLGLISRNGLTPFVPTKDTIGVMARSVLDIAEIAGVIAGPDPGDLLTAKAPKWKNPDFSQKNLKGVRVGFLTDYLKGAEPAVVDAVNRSRETLRKLGANLVEMNISDERELQNAGNRINGWEFKENILRAVKRVRPGIKEAELLKEMDPVVSLFFRKYSEISLEAYQNAVRQTREKIINLCRDYFSLVDILLYPTSPLLPFPVETSSIAAQRGIDHLRDFYGQFRRNSELSGITGFPAITVPGGLSDGGLPIGIEFMASSFQDSRLLEVAHLYQASSHLEIRPAMAALE